MNVQTFKVALHLQHISNNVSRWMVQWKTTRASTVTFRRPTVITSKSVTYPHAEKLVARVAQSIERLRQWYGHSYGDVELANISKDLVCLHQM